MYGLSMGDQRDSKEVWRPPFGREQDYVMCQVVRLQQEVGIPTSLSFTEILKILKLRRYVLYEAGLRQ